MNATAGQLRAELVLVLRDKGIITFALFFPVLTIAFFAYLNRGGRVGDVSYASFLIAGGVGMVVSSAAFENLGVALARQRDDGILKRLGGTPLRPWMLVGAKALGFGGQIVGISVFADGETVRATLQELVPSTAEFLGLDVFLDAEEIVVVDDYLGGGYGVLGASERQAIRLVARSEALLLDPVYTGRAMAGFLDLTEKGVFHSGQTILFWHTGGAVALFAYAEGLMQA